MTEESMFRKLLDGARRAKKMAQNVSVHESLRKQLGADPWASYERDANKYCERINEHFNGAGSQLIRDIKEKKRTGKQTALLDLCGVASAEWADINIGTTFNRADVTPNPQQKILDGDILLPETFEKLLTVLQKTPDLDVVFFSPVGAAEVYQGNEYAYARIAELLRMLYDRLAPGGVMFVDLQNIKPVTHSLEKQFRELFAQTLASVEQTSSLFLYKAAADLPEIRERENIFLIRKPALKHS